MSAASVPPAATRPKPSPARRILLALMYLPLALVGVALLLALLFEWNWLRRPIERYVASTTGRQLVLAGDMSGSWSLPPTLVFRDVRYANPDWATQPNLLEAEEIAITISPWALLRSPRVIEAVEIRGARVGLETGTEDRRSWRFDTTQSDPASAPVLRRLLIERGEVRYLDQASQTDILARVGSRDEGSTAIDIHGRARGTPVAVAMVTVGATEVFGAATAPGTVAPALRGKGTIGDARIDFSGHLGPGYAANGTRLKLVASGPDLAAFRPLARAAIPGTPPYRIDADVAVEQDKVGVVLRPSSFGASRLQGKMEVAYGGERVGVVGRFSADPLDFADLGPLIGVAAKEPAKGARRSGGGATAPGKRPAPADGAARILPATPIDTAFWPNVDLDLGLAATRVVNDGRWAIDTFEFRTRLDRGTLTVSPLSVSIAGGKIDGSFSLARNGKALTLKSQARFSGLRLSRLLPATDRTEASLGSINGSFDLSGEGNSIATILGGANGRLALMTGSGQISNLLLELVGLDGGEALRFLIGGDRRSRLRCAVASLPVRAGVVSAEAVVIDTDDTLIAITGSANLRNEQFDFTMHPQPKDWSLFSVRSPIHLRGSFSQPAISVDAKSLGLRAAGVILLGLINPLAALIPLIETGGGKDADCGELMAGVKAGGGRKAGDRPASGKREQ